MSVTLDWCIRFGCNWAHSKVPFHTVLLGLNVTFVTVVPLTSKQLHTLIACNHTVQDMLLEHAGQALPMAHWIQLVLLPLRNALPAAYREMNKFAKWLMSNRPVEIKIGSLCCCHGEKPNDTTWKKLITTLEAHCELMVNGAETEAVNQEQDTARMTIDICKGSGIKICCSYQGFCQVNPQQ